jgi:hypothetical protein
VIPHLQSRITAISFQKAKLKALPTNKKAPRRWTRGLMS